MKMRVIEFLHRNHGTYMGHDVDEESTVMFIDRDDDTSCVQFRRRQWYKGSGVLVGHGDEFVSRRVFEIDKKKETRTGEEVVDRVIDVHFDLGFSIVSDDVYVEG